MEHKLTVDRREGTGKGSARKLRAAGRVPGVVYGRGSDPTLISVDGRELFHALHTDAGMNVLIELKVDGDKLLAMPREVQRDHLRGQFKHVDFIRIARDEKITVDVPVHIVGDSEGVRQGGVVEHHLWSIELECFPQDVPAAIEADITHVVLGESLKVSDLSFAATVTILTDLEEVIVSIVQPQIMRVEAEGVEGEGEAEGEAGAEAEGAGEGGSAEGSGE